MVLTSDVQLAEARCDLSGAMRCFMYEPGMFDGVNAHKHATHMPAVSKVTSLPPDEYLIMIELPAEQATTC